MGQDGLAKATGRPKDIIRTGDGGPASSQGGRDEPLQKKAKPARQRVPSAPNTGEDSQDKKAKQARAATKDTGLSNSGSKSSSTRQLDGATKGSADRPKRVSQAAQKPAKGRAGASLDPGTPHLPARKNKQRASQPSANSTASTGANAAGLRTPGLSTPTSQTQKTPQRRTKTVPAQAAGAHSGKAQAANAKADTASPHTKVKAEELVKMVVGAALHRPQDESLKGGDVSARQLQDHIMGSFFAGPGFQLPPTPEALPLPSSSLLQHRLSKQ